MTVIKLINDQRNTRYLMGSSYNQRRDRTKKKL